MKSKVYVVNCYEVKNPMDIYKKKERTRKLSYGYIKALNQFVSMIKEILKVLSKY